MNAVERQLKAYNERNIDDFMECYAEDVQVFEFPDKLRFSSNKEMREHYSKMFTAYPNMNAEITKRIFQEPYVVDHEYITGKTEEPFTATAIYELKNDMIIKVWFL